MIQTTLVENYDQCHCFVLHNYMTVKDMKTIASFLLGTLLLFFGASQVFAAPACDSTSNQHACKPENKRMQSRNQMDKTQKRSLRRQHTREAYGQNDNVRTHGMDEDAPRFHKGKKMTQHERHLLRQQIDEAGQAIYHQ